jgi:hypothetical protein
MKILMTNDLNTANTTSYIHNIHFKPTLSWQKDDNIDDINATQPTKLLAALLLGTIKQNQPNHLKLHIYPW